MDNNRSRKSTRWFTIMLLWLVVAILAPPSAGVAAASTTPCGGIDHNNPYGTSDYELEIDTGYDHDNDWNWWSTDFVGEHQAAIRATCTGTVEFAGWDTTGWGNIVVIRDASTDRCWLYAHLDSVAVAVGDDVEAGVMVGRQGRTGNAAGSHLHLSLHFCYPNTNRVGWSAEWALRDVPNPPPPPPCGGTTHSNPYGDVDYFVLQRPGGDYSHSDVWNRYAYDLVAPAGSAIRATCDGVVEFSGYDRSGWGNAVVIRDASTDRCWLYGHFDRLSVSVGDTVQAGTVLGTQGNTGNSTEDHLHLSLHYCYPRNTIRAGWSAPWTLDSNN